MNQQRILWAVFAVVVTAMALIQFIPSEPVILPASLPDEQRETHRIVNFEGVDNFRDLGGYRTADGRRVKWGTLFRSGTFAETSRADAQVLANMGLSALIDFRSTAEKDEEPNQLPNPAPFDIIEIPTLDGGDNSVADEIMARIEDGDFDDFNPDSFMIQANRQFVDEFTPQFSEFIQVLLQAQGKPVVWHCSAGKDRTGYAAAIILRILGVPMETIYTDYMLSKEPALAARQRELTLLRLLKGDVTADKLTVLLGVEREWLEAAFERIDSRWGSFDNYIKNGLQLSDAQILQLQNTLLE